LTTEPQLFISVRKVATRISHFSERLSHRLFHTVRPQNAKICGLFNVCTFVYNGYNTATALNKVLLETCVAMKFVDDDDENSVRPSVRLSCFLTKRNKFLVRFLYHIKERLS